MTEESKDTSTPEPKPAATDSSDHVSSKVEQASPPQSAATNVTPDHTTTTSVETPVSVDDPAPRPRESPVDPKVAALRALFPDFDDALLQYVLESVGGNEDKAIDTLLGMSDPDYRSEAQPQQPMSQTDLDEELARRLYLEDQQQAAAWQAQNEQFQHPGWQGQVPMGHASPRPPPEKDTMSELGEQFNKFAETGKKTLGSLFTKVKAKISEFEQGRQGLNSQANLAGSSTNQYEYAGQHDPYPTHPQQPSYFDPNTQEATGASSGGATPVHGYDTTPHPSTGALQSNTEQSSPGETPRPPPTSSGPIHTGKIGLLPKRPVSLLQTQTPAKEAATHSKDDDELEYVENPFEDGKK